MRIKRENPNIFAGSSFNSCGIMFLGNLYALFGYRFVKLWVGMEFDWRFTSCVRKRAPKRIHVVISWRKFLKLLDLCPFIANFQDFDMDLNKNRVVNTVSYWTTPKLTWNLRPKQISIPTLNQTHCNDFFYKK